MLEKERKLHVCVRVERLSLLSWGEGMPERTSPRPSFWDFWRRHLGVQEHPSTHLVQLTISTTGSLFSSTVLQLGIDRFSVQLSAGSQDQNSLLDPH